MFTEFNLEKKSTPVIQTLPITFVIKASYLDSYGYCNSEMTRHFRHNWRRHIGGRGCYRTVISPESLRHRSRYRTHMTPNCPNCRQLHELSKIIRQRSVVGKKRCENASTCILIEDKIAIFIKNWNTHAIFLSYIR